MKTGNFYKQPVFKVVPGQDVGPALVGNPCASVSNPCASVCNPPYPRSLR